MNRREFMFKLAQLLSDLPLEERSEALKFYNGYFDDAGPKNEQQIIEELISPEHVSMTIHASYNGSAGDGEFHESGYYENYETEPMPPVYVDKKRRKPGHIVLIVILLIFASPILLGLAGTLLGLVAAVFGALVGLVAGLAGGVLGGIVGGVAEIIHGIWVCFSDPSEGLMLCGTGFLGLGLGIILLMLTVWICSKAIPAFFRCIKRIIAKATRRGGRYEKVL